MTDTQRFQTNDKVAVTEGHHEGFSGTVTRIENDGPFQLLTVKHSNGMSVNVYGSKCKPIMDAEQMQLATDLHDKMCKWNHIDQCGWYDAPDEWTDRVHRDYLRRARVILANVDYDAARTVVLLLNG